MFIDPSMGGRIYNPWLAQSNVLQRFGEMNPAKSPQGLEQSQIKPSGQTNYRFFGASPQGQSKQKYQVFRNFF